MKWQKQGLIYVAQGEYPWAKSHAMLPTPDLISDEILRVYLTYCDEHGIGRVGYTDLAAHAPSTILAISSKPILDIGLPGTFDENGVLQTSIVTLPNGDKYLYYVGFELGHKIRYRLLTGLAISRDGGETFARFKKTPILERSNEELYFRCGSFVMLDNGLFRLWYVAGSEWTFLQGKEVPIYTIRYLESYDGIHWGDEGHTCIDIQFPNEHGFGRPYVVKADYGYQMFYSIRTIDKGYRLGYAESKDGITWERKDDQLNLDVSSQGWDSETICYAAITSYQQETLLFYNGNYFGQSGFGYARLER